jgi:deoxyhypusine synthase
MINLLENLYSSGIKNPAASDIIKEMGKMIDNEDSILYWANKNNIPMIIPGIMDGSVGSQIWSFSEQHKDFSLDILKDQHLLSDYVFKSQKSGALIIGGGISKHHTIWWNQFNGGLDYAVYITTANEYDGSLSGARTKEAISWGKISDLAQHVTINAEASIILPLLIKSLINK